MPPLPDIAPAESDPSRLFVAATPPPALPDPNAPRPADPFSGVEIADPTPQPIFEEVSTGWFRAVPPGDPATEALPVLAAAGRAGGPAKADAAASTDAAETEGAEEPAGAAMSAAELAEAIAADFATPADSGWQAVQQAQVQSPTPELTTAGLPKRVPRARLLPGSAGNSAPPTKRDAEIVRGRWASLQRGVREGRETRSTTQTEWE